MPSHEITVASRRRKTETLQKLYPGAVLLDVTSRGEEPWVRFSPFYPHGGIPVPNSPNVVSQSVEGLWQGLKVFEKEGVDSAKFSITTMKSIKRSMRSRGEVLGHRFGVDSEELLDYQTARLKIYLPAYRFVLEHRLTAEIRQLREMAEKQPLVLLDYETNVDVRDLSKPLSHAGLVAEYLREQG